ncbi:MAG: di-trans,poly-cis-decaprenylcistransferase [Chlorobiaceae bacterium]|nr:di-trans,poly-cis-decaprenylcistransferase [Chlorobiaceae bacterium]
MISRRTKNSHIDDNLLQSKLKQSGAIPVHIAIIMDGNGRWAKKRNLPRVAGHKEGVESVRDIVEVCGQIGVQHLTLYAFSTENWKRPKDEVSMLMRLLMNALRDETDKLHKNNVRVKAIGDILTLPVEVRNELNDAKEKTINNTGLQLHLALSYSGRWDITQAVRKIADEIKTGTLTPDQITSDIIEKHLATQNIPDPDLLIRTSGEFRISNFLLWQLAYSEIFISTVCWPDFRRNQLYEAIIDYQKRERRFGMVSEQLGKKSAGSILIKKILKHVSG